MWINLRTFNYNKLKSNSLLLFVYSKKCKQNRQHQNPLFLRISYNGERAELSLRRFIKPELWDNVKQSVKGRNEEAKSINEQITTYKLLVHNHHTRLLKNGDLITAQSLKSAFLGIEEVEKKSLLEAFRYHNLNIESRIGKDYAIATYKRFQTTLSLVKAYLNSTYNTNDIFLKDINLEFVTGFDYYLRVQRNCNNNTTVKYVRNLKKIIHKAIELSWLDKDPFINYKGKVEEVDRECLHEHELELIKNKDFTFPRLDYIKDIFLFSCYTGLAYSDVQKLCKENLIKGYDGLTWIQINRTKTNSLSKIPLLPVAQDILSKYVDNPMCLTKNKLLPVPSNQKVNAYLKEIGVICGIEKTLTFHMARHTFATTVTLRNNIPIETVSRMLGHKSIRTTQHYSKVLDVKVSEDMKQLIEKYSNKPLVNVAYK